MNSEHRRLLAPTGDDVDSSFSKQVRKPRRSFGRGTSTGQRVWAILGSICNLIATAVGTAMLALPIATYYAGAVTGTILIAAIAVLSDVSFIFLARAAERTGLTSMQEVGRYFYGPQGELMVNLALVALLSSAGLSVLLAVEELIIPLWQEVLGAGYEDHWFYQSWVVSLACVLIVFPLSVPDNLKPLRYSSTGCVLSVLLVFGFMMVRYDEHGRTSDKIHLFNESPTVALALPIMSMSFCSQFNMLAIYGELGDHQKDVDFVVHAAVALIGLIYAIFGLVGYLYFGDETRNYSVILDGFHHDRLMQFGAGIVCVTNMLKFPLVIIPFRGAVNSILMPRRPVSRKVLLFETVVLLAAIWGLASVVGDLALGLELCGPTVGVFVCFVLPSMFYFQSEKERAVAEQRLTLDGEAKTTWGQVGAVTVASLGCLMGFASLVALVFAKSTNG